MHVAYIEDIRPTPPGPARVWILCVDLDQSTLADHMGDSRLRGFHTGHGSPLRTGTVRLVTRL